MLLKRSIVFFNNDSFGVKFLSKAVTGSVGFNKTEKLLLVLILAYPLLFIWQGLDFTDTGYILTNYQQIFIEPASIESSFRIWLSDVLGGIWVYFFGDLLGLTGYRLAGVLLVYGTIYVSYKVLRPYLGRTNLLWGLFLASVFINRSGYQFNYNSFTAFFYVLGAYFLIKGLQGKQFPLIFISGFIVGLNLFVRLPNILGVFLVLAILFYGYINKEDLGRVFKQAGIFLAGFSVSIAAVLLLMYAMGHVEAYLIAFRETFSMLEDPTGHHRSEKLINAFVMHHKNMVREVTKILLGLAGLIVVLLLTARFKSPHLQNIIIGGAAVWLLHDNFAPFKDSDWVNMLIIVVGLLYVLLSVLAAIKALQGIGGKDLRLVSFVSLLILVLAPLGSNVAIRNSIYGMYLALPMAIGFIAGIRDIGLAPREFSLLKALAVGVFLFFSLQSTYYFTYRDASDRMSMNQAVEHPKLKGVHTTPQRAEVVQELVEVLPRYVREGDYLLAYEQVSMVHFLTKTKPYLYSSWPMLYSPAAFKGAMERAKKERPYLPVIVRAKGNTEDPNWPTKENKLLRSSNHIMNRQVVEEFIKENNYSLVWENRFFEILKPRE